MGSVSLGGLISGMNTDDLISQLSQVEAQRVRVPSTKKAEVQLKQSAMAQIKSTFQNLLAKLDKLKTRSTYEERKATVADSSVLDATATSGAATGLHTIAVTSMAQAHVVQAASNATSATAALGLTAGTITLNGKTFGVTGTDSLTTIKDKINGLTGANVAAEIITVTNGATTSYKLNLIASKQGTANAVTISDDQGDAIIKSAGLQFKQPDNSWHNEITQAKNAVFKLDNVDFSMETNVISTAIPGVTFTLKKETGTTTIKVEQDADKSVSSIQDWANQLNATFYTIEDKTKIVLKDGAIDKTQSKGPLAGDSLVRGFGTTLRAMLSREVDGLPADLNSLSEIGITTGKYGTADYNRVVVDATKLKEKLQQDPTAVARIFGAVTGGGATNTTGIAKDMHKWVDDALVYQTGPLDSRDSTYSLQIKQYDAQITRIQEHMERYQAQLKRQFTAMEIAIQKLQSQGGAMMQQMSALTGTSSSTQNSK
ncbi:MAG TPA: flagellar filament capping protein FliD [Symbiobacteriaceae bacterium]|nr:flagellar filament capping protein FliD [Symbiobacteriaceae bacterium]